jgi:hypothetical protein
MRKKLVLTGPLKGQTVELRKYRFVDGVCDISAMPDQDVAGLASYMSACYQAELITEGDNAPTGPVKDVPDVGRREDPPAPPAPAGVADAGPAVVESPKRVDAGNGPRPTGRN